MESKKILGCLLVHLSLLLLRLVDHTRIRSSGTRAEKCLGELLRAMFPDLELIERPAELPGKPDWWLPTLRLAAFADGCFFHRCSKHFIAPVNNAAYWSKKIARNRQRDREVDVALRNLNILPVRIWEHSLRKDLTAARRKIRRVLRQRTMCTKSTLPE